MGIRDIFFGKRTIQKRLNTIKQQSLPEEREKQLKASLEVINDLMDSQYRHHVADSIREIFRQRGKETSDFLD